MKKKCMAWLLTLALLLPLLPAAALAAEGGVRVKVSMQQQGSFLAVEKELTVAPGLAARYDYPVNTAVTGGEVTVLDALVALHIDMMGDSDAQTICSLLEVGSNGFITKIFGEDASASSFAVNGVQPTDGVMGLYGYGAYASNAAVISEGDAVDFFFYQDSSYLDLYTYFTWGGKRINSFAVKTGQDLELALVGYCYCYYGAYDQDFIDRKLEAVEGAQLALVNRETGALTELTGAVTGEDGAVTVHFDSAGDYLLSAVTDAEDTASFMPLCQITVKDALTDADWVAVAKANLTWPVVRGNSGPKAVIENFTAPTTVLDGPTVAWSLESSDYNALSRSYYDGKTVYVSRPTAKSADTTGTLTGTLHYHTAQDTVAFRLTVPAEPATEETVSATSFKSLMDGIAQRYQSAGAAENISDELAWVVMDMGAYGAAPAAGVTTAYESAKSSLYGSLGNLAKFAIAEKASGGSGSAALAGRLPDTLGAYDYYSAPYGLLALEGNATDSNAALRESYRSYLLTTGGAWDTTWGMDAPAAAVAGLAPWYGVEGCEAVTAKIDSAITMISQAQEADGSYGNANSSALVVVALAALGIDAHTDSRFIKNNHSAVEGLLTFALADNSGFGLGGNVLYNGMATEQGFRALVAYARFKENGEAYNIYSQSGMAAAVPADPGITATRSPESDSPSDGDSMNVFCTLKTNNATWIAKHTQTVDAGATVWDAFRQMMANREGFSYTAEGAYVSAITRNGTTLAEFGQGPNSGWKYMVNGVAPSVGMEGTRLSAGDNVVWYYVTDYTQDTDRDETPINSTPAPTPTVVPEKEVSFQDVPQTHWAAEAVRFVAEQGLFRGVEEGRFDPEGTANRAAVMTVLYRLSGGEDKTGADSWYADSLAWAKEQGISDGTRPLEAVSRQELVTLLWRYLGSPAVERELTFPDADQISDWARPAMAWAAQVGIIRGNERGEATPQSNATRAQLAAVFQRFLALEGK